MTKAELLTALDELTKACNYGEAEENPTEDSWFDHERFDSESRNLVAKFLDSEGHRDIVDKWLDGIYLTKGAHRE